MYGHYSDQAIGMTSPESPLTEDDSYKEFCGKIRAKTHDYTALCRTNPDLAGHFYKRELRSLEDELSRFAWRAELKRKAKFILEMENKKLVRIYEIFDVCPLLLIS